MSRRNNMDVNPYTTYITKMYRTIPKNCVLITRNKFNGEHVNVKYGGFAMVAPWCESKLVSLAVWNEDYEKLEFDEKEGQQITVDLALSIRVIDPIKFEYSHQNIEQELKTKIYSMMRVLIKKSTYEELSQRCFELPKTGDISQDPRYYFAGGKYYNRNSAWKDEQGDWHADVATDFDLELFKIRRELDEFSFKYGLEIVSLRNKEVQQSKEMQKAYDERVRRRQEMQAKLEESKIENEKVDTEVEITKKRQDAFNDQFFSMYRRAKEEGMSKEDIMELLHTYIVANGKGNNIAGATAQTMAGVAAGQVAANEINNNNNRQKTK